MQVGRYQILSIIGKGATAQMARAFDPMIGRVVAIKLFPKELAQEGARQKFMQEARVVGQLAHPNIVSVYDMGFAEDTSAPFLVMELIDGQPLDKILEKGAVPLSKACAWAGDVATALEIAHKKGVIHGDVKPANILVTTDNRIKLTDFGMARLASKDTGDTPLLGTPAYWCPEQIMGKPQDARSDIFSLGIVIYEMATGHRPFDAESLQGICSRILSSEPLAPSKLNPSLPASFDDIIAGCLAKDPARRRSSAESLAQELYPHARRKSVSPEVAEAKPRIGRMARLLGSA